MANWLCLCELRWKEEEKKAERAAWGGGMGGFWTVGGHPGGGIGTFCPVFGHPAAKSETYCPAGGHPAGRVDRNRIAGGLLADGIRDDRTVGCVGADREFGGWIGGTATVRSARRAKRVFAY